MNKNKCNKCGETVSDLDAGLRPEGATLRSGDMPAIGVRAQCDLCIGWTEGDGSGHEGYNVADYFDWRGQYLGADKHGIEPIFRDMTAEESEEYLSVENQ